MCARVIAFSGNGDLVFVGRSPDPLFDFLSGAFAGTSWEGRLRQLPVSLRGYSGAWSVPGMRETLRRYLAGLDLGPRQIGSRRPTTLVDMVATGGTFGDLVRIWHRWAQADRVPWVELQRKLRLIGLVVRTKTSPKAWRWQQHADWARLLPARAIRNVSAPDWFIYELAGGDKASHSFPPTHWDNPMMSEPSRDPDVRAGLRIAVYLYETGRTASARHQLAAKLAQTPGVQTAWLRSLVVELRARSGAREGFEPVPDDTSARIKQLAEQERRRERNKRRRPVWRKSPASILPPPPTDE